MDTIKKEGSTGSRCLSSHDARDELTQPQIFPIAGSEYK